jgi:hypothetical protein
MERGIPTSQSLERVQVLTSIGGRLLTKPAHSSFALCNLGAVDIRRDIERLAAWVVALRAANNDMVVMSSLFASYF